MEANMSCVEAFRAARAACIEQGYDLAYVPYAKASSFLETLGSFSTTEIALGAGVGLFFLTHQSARWIGYVLLMCFLLIAQALVVAWESLRIVGDMWMVSVVRAGAKAYYIWTSGWRWYRGGSIRERMQLRRELRGARTWEQFHSAASRLDALDGKAKWREAPSDQYNHKGAVAITQQLRDAREAGDVEELVRLVLTAMQRNHLQVDRAVLHCECRVGTKLAIEQYTAELVASLRWLQESEHPALPPREKRSFFERCMRCLGSTALCLSGGGSLSMYHMGVIQALMESKLMPDIISGTSGGSIVAGMLAIYSDEEMLRDYLFADISTRYPERWFPPLEQQMWNFLKQGYLVPNERFAATTKRYYGDTTFREAFDRTGRIVNINISSSSREGAEHRGSLLLNALTTPNVLIRSAVHASCCLPTVMRPTALLAKDAEGRIVPFSSRTGKHAGDEYIDGSFTADIPRQRLVELFHVTQTLVSQVNPHIALVLNQNQGSQFNIFHRLETMFSFDVVYRLQMLAKLRLLPAMYGPDLKSLAVKQRYTGDVTILPRLGWPSCILRMVMNPDKAMMKAYLHEGRAAAFKVMSHIKQLMQVEQALASGLEVVLRAEPVRAANGAAERTPRCRSTSEQSARTSEIVRSARTQLERLQTADGGASPPLRHDSPPKELASALREAEARARAAEARADRLATALRQLRHNSDQALAADIM